MELRYLFTYAPDQRKDFEVRLDPETLDYQNESQAAPPDWTRLEYKQCPDCPLKPKDSPRCPVAVNIAPLVDAFKDSMSYDMADIVVESQGRVYRKRAPMQVGVSGLFGVVMTTSGCPILDRLRPMVFTHLPFPSLQETMYRFMSTYLLGQFFVERKGGEPDWTLKGLTSILAAVNKVNGAFSERLRDLSPRDASVNAVINLDCFAAFTVSTINKSSLAWLERLMKPYWEKEK